ncbi:hypothetical protein ACQEWB_24250 [Streptomyces sp. CA-249302]|uniref:hypothetical protein n=1 Tax=Streptomyces sp. CA-249302 TaxID=3240058 RepID=UPI003D89DF14
MDFYVGRRGLKPVRVAEWQAGKVPFASVRITPETIVDLTARPRGEPNHVQDPDGNTVELRWYRQDAAA